MTSGTKTLNPCHEIVFAALEKFHSNSGRAAAVRDVIAMLDESETTLIRQTYSKKLAAVVSSIMVLLKAKGLIDVRRAGEGRCFYVSNRSPGNIEISDVSSNRQTVLSFVKEAVRHHGRAVRAEEVWNWVADRYSGEKISRHLITRNIISLAQTHDLKRLEISGRGFRGNTFYLPAGLPDEEYIPADESNWLERIAACVRTIWERRSSRVAVDECRPLPVTTGEVRCELYETYPEAVEQVAAKRIINSLLYLSAGEQPFLRKISNSERSSVSWVPAGVADTEIAPPEYVYGSDAERIEEATRKAERLYKRPVNRQEVETQIEGNEFLEIKSISGVARLLSDAAKPMVINKLGGKAVRKISYVGSINGKAYYTADTINLGRARQLLDFERLKSDWEKMTIVESLAGVRKSSLPLMQWGQSRLIESQIDGIETRLKTLRTICEKEDRKGEFAILEQNVGFAAGIAHSYKNDLRKSVAQKYDLEYLSEIELSEGAVGLIPAETVKVLQPFYPMARRLTKEYKIVTLLDGAVRRFPNPKFTSRFSKNPHTAAEYLYDRTALLIYTAIHWGNRFARLQAVTARQELGQIRNPNFIFPLLKDPDFTVRLKAVACLAFLAGDGIASTLKEISQTDIEPNVRLAAEWSELLLEGKPENLQQAFKLSR